MNRVVKNELVGRLFRFGASNQLMVILAVRRPATYLHWLKERGIHYKDYNHYEVLVGRVYMGGCSIETGEQHINISICSWYAYSRYSMFIDGRGTRKAIHNCMTKQPDKIKWHTGRRINIHSRYVQIYDEHKLYLSEL